MRTRGLAIAALVVAVWFAFGTAVWAEQGEMKLRFGVLDAIPTDDYSDAESSAELDDAIGFHAGVEFGINDLIGVEPVVSLTSHDVTGKESGFPDQTGDIDLWALLANVNFHVVQRDRLGLYVGPTVGYAFWSDLSIDGFSQDLSVDGEFIYGANAGIDVPFGSGAWGFSGGLSYLFTEVNVEDSDEAIGVDPFLVKVGLSYSF